MANTNFGMLSPDNIKVLITEVKRETEAQSFLLPRFCGTGPNFPIQKITKMKRTPGGGSECIMTLVAQLVGDGGVGSTGGKREGMEEAMAKFNYKLAIDEMFHSVRNKGELADQDSVVDFRSEARAALTYWQGNRRDQLIMLTASGISYAYNLDGSLRNDLVMADGTKISSKLIDLNFASYVTAPTTKRHRRWDGATKRLVAGDTSAVTTSDIPTYKMLLSAKAYAKTHRIMPLKAGGKEWYVVMMHPYTAAQIKNDADYKTAIIQGGVRGDDNPFFTGALPTVDGLLLVDYEYVYNTNGAATRWGIGGDVNGTRTLIWGAQALGFADLDNSAPKWTEKGFEYDSEQGISLSTMLSVGKPKFRSTFDQSEEDFSCLAIDHYMEEY